MQKPKFLTDPTDIPIQKGGDLSGKKNSDRAPLVPKKIGKTWRNEALLSHKDNVHSEKNPLQVDQASKTNNTLIKLEKGTHECKITLPEYFLSSRINFLRQTTLIGKFWNPKLKMFEIFDWAKSIWNGVKDVFYTDSKSKYFITLFDTKINRDAVHKNKGWFFKGSGLFTLP